MSKKKKQKSPMVALAIGAAVLAYFLFTKKSTTTTTDTTVVDDGSGGTTAPPPPPPPVYQTGLDTSVITTVLNHQTITDLQTAYNTIYSLPSTSWAGWGATEKIMAKMKADGNLKDLQAIAEYITNFLSKGIPLTRTSDNAALYDAIMKIHATYNIF